MLQKGCCKMDVVRKCMLTNIPHLGGCMVKLGSRAVTSDRVLDSVVGQQPPGPLTARRRAQCCAATTATRAGPSTARTRCTARTATRWRCALCSPRWRRTPTATSATSSRCARQDMVSIGLGRDGGRRRAPASAYAMSARRALDLVCGNPICPAASFLPPSSSAREWCSSSWLHSLLNIRGRV